MMFEQDSMPIATAAHRHQNNKPQQKAPPQGDSSKSGQECELEEIPSEGVQRKSKMVAYVAAASAITAVMAANREVDVSESATPCLVENDMHKNSLPFLKEIKDEITAHNLDMHEVINCYEIVWGDYVILGGKFPVVNTDYASVVRIVKVYVEPYILHVDPKMPMCCETYNYAEIVGMDYVGWIEEISEMNIDFAYLAKIVLTTVRGVLQDEVKLDVFYGNPRMQGCSKFPFDPGGMHKIIVCLLLQVFTTIDGDEGGDKKLNELGEYLTAIVGVICAHVGLIHVRYFLSWEFVDGWHRTFEKCTIILKLLIALAAIPKVLKRLVAQK